MLIFLYIKQCNFLVQKQSTCKSLKGKSMQLFSYFRESTESFVVLLQACVKAHLLMTYFANELSGSPAQSRESNSLSWSNWEEQLNIAKKLKLIFFRTLRWDISATIRWFGTIFVFVQCYIFVQFLTYCKTGQVSKCFCPTSILCWKNYFSWLSQ